MAALTGQAMSYVRCISRKRDAWQGGCFKTIQTTVLQIVKFICG
jgi:hypothetical protein